MATARALLELQTEIVPPALVPGLIAQAQRNLDLAQDALEFPASADDLRDALHLAQRATAWQGASFGMPLPDLVAPQHASPSEALRALLTRHGVAPNAEQDASMRTLDALGEPARSALTRFVDAFLAFDDAARVAFGPDRVHELSLLQAKGEALEPVVGLDAGFEPPASPGSGFGGVLAARNLLLDALPSLRDAFAQPVPGTVCGTVTVAPYFSLDVAGCDDTYTEDVALLLDVGGSERYWNNAGGGAAFRWSLSPRAGAAAALVDLGNADDEYGRHGLAGRGMNGGGFLGAGFLIDFGGDDRYVAADTGTNGGGYLGLGSLLDLGGNDAYSADSFSTNGGGSAGAGFLLDLGGDDVYQAKHRGTNGGAHLGGLGFLLDGDGDDTYVAWSGGTNGGGYTGSGFLLDRVGDDRYSAWGSAGNGGSVFGSGFLLDGGGNDAYDADWASNGGSHAGVGILLDAAGTDRYADGVTACWDCSVYLKVISGLQLDSTRPVPGVLSLATRVWGDEDRVPA